MELILSTSDLEGGNLEGLKVAHKHFTLEWQQNTTYRYVWWTQLVYSGWMHEWSSYSVQVKASNRLGSDNQESSNCHNHACDR